MTDYPSDVAGTGDGTAKRAATSSSSGWAMPGPGVTAVASLHQPAVEEKQLSGPPAFPCAWTKFSPQSPLGILQKTIPLYLLLPCPLTQRGSFQHDVVFNLKAKLQSASVPGVMV